MASVLLTGSGQVALELDGRALLEGAVTIFAVVAEDDAWSGHFQRGEISDISGARWSDHCQKKYPPLG
jgi:hypothetical protein